MKRYQQSMLQGPLLWNILTYTIPIIITGILQLLFNAADLVVVGQFCGSISLAAVGATGNITSLIVTMFVGLSTGAGICMAQATGAKNDGAMHRTVHTAVPIALAGGVVLTIVGVVWCEPLLRMMDTPENVLPLSAVYMRIYFAGITFNLIYNFCAAILQAVGDTKSPLTFLFISGVTNVVLNFIFVVFFHMNVAGVALATTISQGISAILVVRVLMRRTDASKLELKKIQFYKKQLVRIITLGLPAGIQSSMFSISNVIIQSSINSFGDALMSGNAASVNIEGFASVTVTSFYQSALNFTGQNVGAGQHRRVGKILWTCLGCVTIIGICAGALLYLFAPQLLSIYITDSAEALAYGVTRLSIVGVSVVLVGLMNVTTGMLRGLGSSLVPMVISVLGVCGIRIVWIYTIFQDTRYHTPENLYISYPISWLITFLLNLAVFYLIWHRHKKRLQVPA